MIQRVRHDRQAQPRHPARPGPVLGL